MRKSHFPLLLILIPFVSFAAFGALGLALSLAGLFASYFVSLRLHPRTRHTGFRGCGGTGEHRGAVFTWVHRKCPGCQGGRLVRFGAGQFGSEPIKTEYRRGKAARKKAKQDKTWR